jgi:hypothetical protein
MYKKSILQPILFLLISVIFTSCDKDFNEIGNDIIGDDHFGFEKNTDVSIKAFNQKIGPIASNNLPINPLGFYQNPAFGSTQANFVTQVELSSVNPKFNNTNDQEYDILPTVLDSVIMEVPYFKTFIKTEAGVSTFRLDSIYGATPYDQTASTINSKFRLSVYQSNFYLRDLDPGQSLSQLQDFYTDENTTIDNNKIPVLLNDLPPTDPRNTDGHENDAFYFDKREHRTSVLNDNNEPVYTRSAPSMRLHLNNAVFNNLILNAPSGKLVDNTTFKNYFRGLYFKVENGAPGNMAMLNFKAGKITLYYNEDKKKTVNNVVTFERVNKTLALNMTGNCISLLKNSNESVDYLNATNSTNEASKLYLKGGEGSIAMIDLFGDPADSNYDTYRYVIKKNDNGKPVDQNGVIIPLDLNGNPTSGNYFIYTKTNSPNGISDELDDLRYPLINDVPGQIYHSIKNRWMINDANLVFYIAKTEMSDATTIEPGRIFLYDLTNKKALFDYSFDFTSNALFPKFNKGIFGGILLDDKGKILKQKNSDGVFVNKGTKYKIRITNHIRNLIKNDSTNVRFGVSVTENIGNIGFSKLRNPNSNFNKVPAMSVLSPLGTILYGTNPAVSDDKKLKLEIYYTKPN